MTALLNSVTRSSHTQATLCSVRSRPLFARTTEIRKLDPDAMVLSIIDAVEELNLTLRPPSL